MVNPSIQAKGNTTIACRITGAMKSQFKHYAEAQQTNTNGLLHSIIKTYLEQHDPSSFIPIVVPMVRTTDIKLVERINCGNIIVAKVELNGKAFSLLMNDLLDQEKLNRTVVDMFGVILAPVSKQAWQMFISISINPLPSKIIDSQIESNQLVDECRRNVSFIYSFISDVVVANDKVVSFPVDGIYSLYLQYCTLKNHAKLSRSMFETEFADLIEEYLQSHNFKVASTNGFGISSYSIRDSMYDKQSKSRKIFYKGYFKFL